MRMDKSWRLLVVGAPMLMVAQMLVAQDAAPAVAAPQAAQGAAPSIAAAVPVESKQAEKAKAEDEKRQEKTKAEDEKRQEKAKAEEAKKAKKEEEAKKKIYTGPNSVIVLPPTPMLDEEGKQRLDPDNQPMFNPAVRQQRDKKGHPLFDEKGKPVFQTASDKGYDEHGKKIKVVKEKPPKMIPVTIARGTFTVDGMIGKAELNYNIADFKYMYLYAPGIGTLVVSDRPFQGGKEEKNAFNDKTLTVTTEDHKLQVASDVRLLPKGKKAESAYVLVDRDFFLPTPYPVVGYGGIVKAPYVWPGSRENAPLKGAFVAPPPIPVDLRPVMLLSACPTGQMRKSSPPVLPGQKEIVQPCIPIPKGKVTMSGPAMRKTAQVAPATTPAPATPPAPTSTSATASTATPNK
ncbi:MAG: hypothetical protein WBY53_10845 [Acidobacteriaceae bacterium]